LEDFALKRLLGATLLVLALTASPAFADPPAKPATTDDVKAAQEAATQSGDIAWMLISTGLVLFMVPGLAMFYGGMVRRKNVLGTMMHSMVAIGIVGIYWVLIGYSLAFGHSLGGWIGWSPDLIGLNGILEFKDGVWQHRTFPGTKLPILLHCMYQGMFAIITPALISGALAERIRFGPYCLFLLLWSTLVYSPLAHWVWAVDEKGNPAGWLGKMGALDFAGGTVVHIAAGLSGLAAILVLRKREGYPEHAMHPNSMVITLLGAGFLWVGWFGFNGGSALASNGLAASALAASQVAAAGAALSWMVAEWCHKGKPTALGLASGLVAGLVAVTPASGFVTPAGALVIGALAGVVCYTVVCCKPLLKYDDSLDAFGVHGVGGFLGAFLTGVFADVALYKAGAGLAEGEQPNGALTVGKLVLDGGATSGRMEQIAVQLLAALVTVVLAFVASLVLVKLVDVLCGGFCLSADKESEGLDRAMHGEVGFDFGPAIDVAPERALPEPRPAMVPPDGQERFTVLVDGADDDKLIQVWSALCQTGPQPPEAEFLAVYPYLTTVQGNRFRFRGGDPSLLRDNLARLFQKHLGGHLRTYLETGGRDARKPGNGHYGGERVPTGAV
jgi:ammonium transporter